MNKTLQVFRRNSRWYAHLYFADGTCFSYWQGPWRSKTQLLEQVKAVSLDITIERGIDE